MFSTLSEKDRCCPSRGGISYSVYLMVVTTAYVNPELVTYWFGLSISIPGHVMLVSFTDVAFLSERKSYNNVNGYRMTITENT